MLGPLEVRGRGGSIEIPGHKERTLIACLLSRANAVVSLDELAESLWGEHPPPTARKSLQAHVAHLRRALGGEGDGVSVVTRGTGYAIKTDADHFDAAAFELLAAQGRRLVATGSPEPAALALEEALRLWRGDAYQEFFDTADAARCPRRGGRRCRDAVSAGARGHRILSAEQISIGTWRGLRFTKMLFTVGPR